MICGVCGLGSAALYRDACARCNAIRLRAAREFIHAAEAVRLMAGFGARIVAGHRRPPHHRSRLEHAMFRLSSASAECVRLKMWPAERSTRKPPWFYGDERRNAR